MDAMVFHENTAKVTLEMQMQITRFVHTFDNMKDTETWRMLPTDNELWSRK